MGNSDSRDVGHDTTSAAGPAAGRLHAAPSFRGVTFADRYDSISDLQRDLTRAGLESSNLIYFIDCTKSNEWTGRHSFGSRPLHTIDPRHQELNPYESAIMICGATLSVYDEDSLIPAYGFGDARTHDASVFSFRPGDRPCHGFEEVLSAYREVMPAVKLAGPTSFGPVIRKAMHIVKSSGGAFHIAIIICDGQVTRSSDLSAHELSPQERDTIDALVEASRLPLSIVVIGVGDGEDGWRYMKELDDRVPRRAFDNLQFVALNETLAKAQQLAGPHVPPHALKATMEATFACAALMEVPDQFKAISSLGLLGPAAAARCTAHPVTTLDPPVLPPAPRSPAADFPAPGPALAAGPQFAGGYGDPYLQARPVPAYGAPAASHTGDFGLSALGSQSARFHGGFADARASAPVAPAYGAPPPYVGAVPLPAHRDSGAGLPFSYAADAAPKLSSAVAAGTAAAGLRGGVSAGPAASASTTVSARRPPPPAAAADDPTPPSAAAASAVTDAANESARLQRELESMREERTCPVCLERPKNEVFQCGHQVCAICSPRLTRCPVCRAEVTNRIKLF